MKDKSIMVAHGTSLELPLEHQRSYLTPVEHFFVCNSGSSPVISKQDYTLRIWGDGVSNELVLNYADLDSMEKRTVPAIIECAGNHRALFQAVDNKTIATPVGTAELIWFTGAVGMAEWTGVPLINVLKQAGIKDDALQVCATGSEEDSIEGAVRLPLPLKKAMDKDTLLATSMNGQPLGIDHGAPVRVLVPGWIGAYSIKWVQDIEVNRSAIWVRRNTESYVMMGTEWPESDHAPSKGKPITELNIKSTLALPWPGELSIGKHQLHGYARSPGQKIQTVEWSDNNGQSWQQAQLGLDNEKYGWVKFTFDWLARKGKQTIMTRATDQAGRKQPATVPFNTAGYLYNAIHPHPINVQ